MNERVAALDQSLAVSECIKCPWTRLLETAEVGTVVE